MLAIKNRLNQWQRIVASVVLVGLIWFMSLPTNSVEAAGYYVVKDHNSGVAAPYYTNKQRRIGYTEPTTPYYATQNRKKHITRTSDDYIESGKRAGEVIPKELGTGKRQKNSVTMLRRSGE